MAATCNITSANKSYGPPDHQTTFIWPKQDHTRQYLWLIWIKFDRSNLHRKNCFTFTTKAYYTTCHIFPSLCAGQGELSCSFDAASVTTKFLCWMDLQKCDWFLHVWDIFVWTLCGMKDTSKMNQQAFSKNAKRLLNQMPSRDFLSLTSKDNHWLTTSARLEQNNLAHFKSQMVALLIYCSCTRVFLLKWFEEFAQNFDQHFVNETEADSRCQVATWSTRLECWCKVGVFCPLSPL